MAPLPTNATNRIWVRYSSNGREHELMFRFQDEYFEDGADITTHVARIAALLSDISTFLPTNFSVISARFSRTGWTYSLPLTPPASPSGSGVPAIAEAPAFMTFVGRTTGGRRWKLHVLGVAFSAADEAGIAADYRIQPGQSSALDAAVANLDGWPGLCGVDGQNINVYGYVNAGYNAYWQRAVRA